MQTQVIVTDPAFQGRTPGPADPALLEIFNGSIAGAYDRAAMLSEALCSRLALVNTPL